MTVDISKAIEAKSDQLNAVDLVGGSRTITISNVTMISGDQPLSIYYDGDNKRPWKPCRTAARILATLWGLDGKQYIGRKVTLYFDKDVVWGGEKVGGVRVSHLSNIEKQHKLVLSVSRHKKQTFTIDPYTEGPKALENNKVFLDALEQAKKGNDAMLAHVTDLKEPQQAYLRTRWAELKAASEAFDNAPDAETEPTGE